MERPSQRVPPVRVRVGPPKVDVHPLDELMGRRVARCVDCGVFTSRSHAGRCEEVARGAKVSPNTVKRLRNGEREELIATPGMRGKRVRREVAQVDIIGCVLEKGLSLRESGRVLGQLAREFNRLARVEAEEKMDRLRDAGGYLDRSDE